MRGVRYTGYHCTLIYTNFWSRIRLWNIKFYFLNLLIGIPSILTRFINFTYIDLIGIVIDFYSCYLYLHKVWQYWIHCFIIIFIFNSQNTTSYELFSSIIHSYKLTHEIIMLNFSILTVVTLMGGSLIQISSPNCSNKYQEYSLLGSSFSSFLETCKSRSWPTIELVWFFNFRKCWTLLSLIWRIRYWIIRKIILFIV